MSSAIAHRSGTKSRRPTATTLIIMASSLDPTFLSYLTPIDDSPQLDRWFAADSVQLRFDHCETRQLNCGIEVRLADIEHEHSGR